MAVAIPKDIEKLFDEEWSESIEATECHMMYSDYNPTRLSALAEMHHNDKEYKEEIKILNKLIAMHSTYYFKADYSWQKIKALFLSFRLLEIIPTYIFMIKMKFEDFKLGFTPIE